MNQMNIKKILAVLLAVCMIMTNLAAPVAYAESSEPAAAATQPSEAATEPSEMITDPADVESIGEDDSDNEDPVDDDANTPAPANLEETDETTAGNTAENTSETTGEETDETTSETTGENTDETTSETAGEETDETTSETTGENTDETTSETTGEETDETTSETTAENTDETVADTTDDEAKDQEISEGRNELTEILGGKVQFKSPETGNSQDAAPVNEGELTVDVGMYTNAEITQGKVALTVPVPDNPSTPDIDESKQGAQLTDWQHSTDRYLGIKLDHLNAATKYRVLISMEPVLYVNLENDPALEGATVTFEQNDTLGNPVYADKYHYTPKPYSLKELAYVLNENPQHTVTGTTINIPIRYDLVIWDKLANSFLGDGENPLLTVKLQQEVTTEEDGQTVKSYVDIKNLELKNASTGMAHDDSKSNWFYKGDDTANYYSSSIVIAPTESAYIRLLHMVNSNYADKGHFYKNFKVTFTIPNYTDAETTYYMIPSDYAKWDYAPFGTPTYTQTATGEYTTVTYEATDIYFPNNDWFYLRFNLPDAVKSIRKKCTFNGNVKIVADGNYLNGTNGTNVSVTMDNAGLPNLVTYSTGTRAVSTQLGSAAMGLGTLGIQNKAAIGNDSGPMTIEVTFNSNNNMAVGVTSYRLMIHPDDENITITYTLVDENGTLYVDADGKSEFTVTVANRASGEQVKNSSQLFSRNDLQVQEHKKYYFKTIRYNIASIDGNIALYSTSGVHSPASGGTIYGRVLGTAGQEVAHSMRVKKAENNDLEIEDLPEIICYTKLTDALDSAYGLSGAQVSKTSIEAGESVTVSGKVTLSEYPYGNGGIMKDVLVGFELPQGVKVNQASITGRTKVAIAKEKITLTEKVLPDNRVFYIIKFDLDEPIGRFTDTRGVLPAGSELSFQFDLDSETYVSTETIILREHLFAASTNNSNKAGGGWADRYIKDEYDLNGNNSTTDAVGSFNKDTTAAFTINAAPATLDISANISKGEETGTSLNMNQTTDLFNYHLNIECTNRGSASGFVYYIPVKDCKEESNFLANQETDRFELKLTGPAAVVPPEAQQNPRLKVEYTFETDLSYNQASTAKWYPGDQFPTDMTWDKVTMVRIMPVDENAMISTGAKYNISLPLVFDGDYTKFSNNAGMQVIWSGRGYYQYQLGSTAQAGHRSSEKCTITIQYTPVATQTITLTAAQNRDPQVAGNVVADEINLIQFTNIQEYTITDVKTSNVTLVDKNTNFAELSGAEANSQFAIAVGVKPYDENVDPETVAGSVCTQYIELGGTYVGKMEAGIHPQFFFTIYNADRLSDIVTERYIELTLIGSNGVLVPVRININRELSAAEPTAPAIIGGKEYRPFESKQEITISDNSAYTAQFVTTGMNTSAYSNRVLRFEKAPAAGTTITLIDYTNPSAPRYYYYETKGNEKDLELTEKFKMMGSTTTAYSSYQLVNATVDERLLFIVQYPAGGDVSNKLWMTTTHKKNDGTDETITSDVLTVTTGAKRNFTLTAEKTTVTAENPVKLTYGTSTDVTDYRYNGRALALVFTGTFPESAQLLVNNTYHYQTTDGKFIVPVGNIQEITTAEANVSLLADLSEEITMTVSLWASATSAGPKPMLGELRNQVAEPVNITVTPVQMPSLKVESMSARVLHTKAMVVPELTYAAQNCTDVKLILQKKINNSYLQVNTILNQVNGQGHQTGVFDVSEKGGTLELSVTSLADPGTYRLLFKAYNGTNYIEVPYNFIITE